MPLSHRRGNKLARSARYIGRVFALIPYGRGSGLVYSREHTEDYSRDVYRL
jgi:hypothetical protein